MRRHSSGHLTCNLPVSHNLAEPVLQSIRGACINSHGDSVSKASIASSEDWAGFLTYTYCRSLTFHLQLSLPI